MKHSLRAGTQARLVDARFNADRTRFCLPSLDGIACYRGMIEAQGEWVGHLMGFASNDEDAQRFLEGAFVQLIPPAQ